MEFAKDAACPSEYSDDKESEVNLNILEEHFEELNVDPVGAVLPKFFVHQSISRQKAIAFSREQESCLTV